MKITKENSLGNVRVLVASFNVRLKFFLLNVPRESHRVMEQTTDYAISIENPNM